MDKFEEDKMICKMMFHKILVEYDYTSLELFESVIAEMRSDVHKGHIFTNVIEPTCSKCVAFDLEKVTRDSMRD
jgi:hypothetical protein